MLNSFTLGSGEVCPQQRIFQRLVLITRHQVARNAGVLMIANTSQTDDYISLR